MFAGQGVAPTIEIRTDVYTETRRGRWAWLSAGQDYPSAREYIYTSDELSRVLYVYGAVVARCTRPDEMPRGFRLTAHALPTGQAVGEHEWRVSAETGHFVPVDVPWVLLDEYRKCA